MEIRKSSEVKCYSGYTAIERVIEFPYGDAIKIVKEVLRRWYSRNKKQFIGFIVKTETGELFKLLYSKDEDLWFIYPYPHNYKP